MEINVQGTRTGRISSKKPARSNKPKAQVAGTMTTETGEVVTLFVQDVPDETSGIEIVGMHMGPRTKYTHPYSYDPILQFSTGEAYNGSLYSDRLSLWYSHERIRDLKQKHFNSGSDYYSSFAPKHIEAFLRELLEIPDLKLVRIEEHCNVATGYPCWFFGYIKLE